MAAYQLAATLLRGAGPPVRLVEDAIIKLRLAGRQPTSALSDLGINEKVSRYYIESLPLLSLLMATAHMGYQYKIYANPRSSFIPLPGGLHATSIEVSVTFATSSGV